MPTFRHGKTASLYLDTTAGTLLDVSTGLDDITFSMDVDLAEVTVYGSTSKAYISGLKDATFSISGNWHTTFDAHLFRMMGTTTKGFQYAPESTASLRVKYTGECFLTSYEISSPVGDKVTISAEFQVTGNVTRGTF